MTTEAEAPKAETLATRKARAAGLQLSSRALRSSPRLLWLGRGKGEQVQIPGLSRALDNHMS